MSGESNNSRLAATFHTFFFSHYFDVYVSFSVIKKYKATSSSPLIVAPILTDYHWTRQFMDNSFCPF